MMKRRHVLSTAFVLGTYALVVACGGDDEHPAASPDAGHDATVADTGSITDAVSERGLEQTGQACTAASQCYPQLDGQALKGTATCLDQVTGGYCTHTCTQDSDCCAVPGECKTGLKQVCASFESTGQKYCFLSCESADIATASDAGNDAGTDSTAYCQYNASPDFGCRSTGGGNQNRQVCLPSGAPSDGGGGGPKDAATDG